MSKNMVERVARAICDSVEADDFDALGQNSVFRAVYVQQARAAIEAMREPTEAMVEAAHVAEPNPVLGGYALEDDGPGTIWNAMIAASLKP